MVSTDPEQLDLRGAAVLVCVIYTAITLASSSYALASGVTEDTHEHLLIRFAVTVLGVGAFYGHGRLRRLMASVPSVVVGATTYVLAMGAVFAFVWVYGRFAELHPDAYRDIFLNFTAAFLVIAAVQVALARWRRRRGAVQGEEAPTRS